jgi:hypothetical protein
MQFLLALFGGGVLARARTGRNGGEVPRPQITFRTLDQMIGELRIKTPQRFVFYVRDDAYMRQREWLEQARNGWCDAGRSDLVAYYQGELAKLDAERLQRVVDARA